MATLLIIGGTGFFGKSILDCYKRKLLAPWGIDRIVVMSRNSGNFKYNHPELVSTGVEFFTGDITTINSLPSADYVIHAAASSNASLYLGNNAKEKRNIIKGTLNYCRLASKFHKDSKIVFCSSGAVYGYQPKDVKFLTEDMFFGDVEGLVEAKKSYAYAKRDSEKAIQKLGQEGLDVSIARCFSFVGKYLPLNQHFAVGNFILNAISGDLINVKSDRLVYRSYMYADDLVEWLMAIAQDSNTNCPIYNVGSEEKVEIRELARVVSSYVATEVVCEYECTNRGVDNYIPSTAKVENNLGLRIKHNLQESIKKTFKRITNEKRGE